MKRLGVALLPLAALLFAFGCQQGDKDKPGAKTDAELIQGTWKVVRSEQEGEESDWTGRKVVISDKDFAVWGDDGEMFKWTYKLHPSTNPKGIDLGHEVAREVKKDGKEVKLPDPHPAYYKAIYELDGDTLKVYYPHGEEAPRPKSFTAKAEGGIGLELLVLKRNK